MAKNNLKKNATKTFPYLSLKIKAMKAYKIQPNADASTKILKIHKSETKQIWWQKSKTNANTDIHIVAGADDGKIKIWSMSAGGKCLKTLSGNAGAIEYLLLVRSRNELISTSWDNTVRIWDSRTYECLKTLHGHSNWVRCLIKIEKTSFLVTSSGDTLIKGN